MLLALVHYLFCLLQFLGSVVVLYPFPRSGETTSMATMTSVRRRSKQSLTTLIFANNVILQKNSAITA